MFTSNELLLSIYLLHSDVFSVTPTRFCTFTRKHASFETFTRRGQCSAGYFHKYLEMLNESTTNVQTIVTDKCCGENYGAINLVIKKRSKDTKGKVKKSRKPLI